MASCHLSVKTISRAQGRSATAAAAYRSGGVIACERYGVEHDYTRKDGIYHTELVLPEDAPDWSHDRVRLWNAVEAKETGKNSMVAREWEIALPCELNADQRRSLVVAFSRDLVERYGIAADVAIHAPHREGDQRNHHAHILTTTRTLTPEGLDAKTREIHGQRGAEEIRAVREHWAELSNAALERAGQSGTPTERALGRLGRADKDVYSHPTKQGINADLALQRIHDAPNVDKRTRENWAARDIQNFARSSNARERDAERDYSRALRDVAAIYAKARDDIRDIKHGPERTRGPAAAKINRRTARKHRNAPRLGVNP